MKSYDEFLTWAAEKSYNDWTADLVSWGGSQSPVIETGAAIYNRPVYNVAESIRTRVNAMYGDRLQALDGEEV